MQITDRNSPLARILDVMNDREFTGAVFQYSGLGDSMDNCSIQVTKQESPEEFFRSLTPLEDENDTLIDLMIEFLEEVEPGYEIEDGSNGSMIFMVKSGHSISVDVNHSDVNLCEEDDTDLSENVIHAISKILTSIGVKACTINYAGSGDSMDGLSVSYEDEHGQNIDVDDPSVESEICKIMDEVISNSSISGFWNDEGGFGRVRVSTADNDSEWSHYNNTAHQSGYDFSLNQPE